MAKKYYKTKIGNILGIALLMVRSYHTKHEHITKYRYSSPLLKWTCHVKKKIMKHNKFACVCTETIIFKGISTTIIIVRMW